MDARAFAEWAGKRLPKGREWEKAERGKEGFLFPWGNDADTARANVGSGELLPVSDLPNGASPYGALNMSGNVWELVDQVSPPGNGAFAEFARLFHELKLAPPTRDEPWYMVRGQSFLRRKSSTQPAYGHIHRPRARLGPQYRLPLRQGRAVGQIIAFVVRHAWPMDWVTRQKAIVCPTCVKIEAGSSMDRPAAANPATARDIIREIVRNMGEGLEPLHYSTLPPAIFHVYLHPSDMERLRGILPRILDEARRALDAELESLNRASLGERLKLARRSDPRIVAPEGGWQIRILENTDEDVEPGDIAISSELALPSKGELGSGSTTKRIATRRLGGVESTKQSYDASPDAAALAVIEYEDSMGHKTYRMTKDEIVVGRGGRDYWTDIKLETLPDVSREHCRLRRDPASGQFFLKDLSQLGTTIDGVKAPSSIEMAGGEKRDRNLEAPVPARARIGLAGVVFLEFRSTSNG